VALTNLVQVEVVGAVDDERDVSPEMAFAAIEVAGVRRRGQQAHMVGDGPVADLLGPTSPQAVHNNVDPNLGRVAAARCP
jgi:hypothetical protein